ncbi:uncharacterized protein LOC115221679 isoform X4 [Argonauta hians]
MSSKCRLSVLGGRNRWSPFFSPNTQVFTMVLMTILVLIPSSTQQNVAVNLSPLELPRLGSQSRLNITCSFSGRPNIIRLLRDTTEVVQVNFDRGDGTFKYKSDFPKFSFRCDIAAIPKTDSGDLRCWKTNLQCADMKPYSCAVDTDNPTASKTISVKSSVHSLDHSNPPYQLNRTATFVCRANADSSKSSSLIFTWEIRRNNNNNNNNNFNNIGTQNVITDTKTVTIPSNGGCYPQVTSTYDYVVSREDAGNTTVTCKLQNGDEQTIIINVEVPPVVPPDTGAVQSAGLDGGTIAGIVLGVIAFIILVVLLIWFFVIRKRNTSSGSKKESSGPPPNQKDYKMKENTMYADPIKMKGKSTPSSGNDYHNGPGSGYSNPSGPKQEVYSVDGKGRANPGMDAEEDDYDGGASRYGEYAPGSAV